MCRTGVCRFGLRNWIFLFATLHLFTYAQGGEDAAEEESLQFALEPSDAVVAPGAAALLPCAVAGSAGPPRLSWRHSVGAAPTREDALSPLDKYRQQLPNGSLAIARAAADTAGHYQCVAAAPGLGRVVSRVATLYLAELPEILEGPRSVLGVAGQPVLLACPLRAPPPLATRVLAPEPARRAAGARAAPAAPAPPTLLVNVTWLKDGLPVRLEPARVAVGASGALELDPARAHDAGRYRCRVALPHEPHRHSTGPETQLLVSAEPAPGAAEPPRFIAAPRDAAVLEGASVSFDCAAVGQPRPEIAWLHDGVPIDLSDLDSRYHVSGAGSLRVLATRAGDGGVYTCRARGVVDARDRGAELRLMTPPRVHIANGPVVTAEPRGDATLRCEARGRPAPRVAWLKDGEPLTLAPERHDIALVDGTSLRIQGVLPVDAGTWQCAASSRAGSAVRAVRLRVQPAHDSPPRNATRLKTIDTKSFLNSLVPAINTSSRYNNFPKNLKSRHPSPQHIFNSLVSSGGPPDTSLDPDDPDFLGETASAYTPRPEWFDDNPDMYQMSDYTEDLESQEMAPSNISATFAPRALRAVLVKHRFVTLSWDAPEAGDTAVTGYTVLYRVKGSDRERAAHSAGARRSLNVAGLQPNTTYEFSARARGPQGASPPTQSIEATTPEEEYTHGPPLHVRAEALGPHAVRAWWEPPAPAPGAQQPRRYAVYYTEAESGREQVQYVESTASATESTTLSGLRAAAGYWLRVAAAGAGEGEGEPSAELRVGTWSDAPAAPPDNVTALAAEASITVQWSPPPARTHRGPLTGYKLRYRAAPPAPAAAGRGKADSLTTPADARSAELGGLEPGTAYQVRICALNANGSGPFSEWLSVRTLARPRARAHAVPAQPPPLTTRAGRDWISVWWAGDAGDGEARYWLGWGLGVPDEHAHELPAAARSHVIRGLQSNSEYVISLRASNSLGPGPPVYATVRTRAGGGDGEGDGAEEGWGDEEDADEEGEEEEEAVPPLIPPVGLKVIMLSGSTAVVYWADPSLPKGQTATDGRRYVVRYAAVGEAGAGKPRVFNATDLSCMLDELRPHTTYEFAVKLIKGGRESAWSMLASNTTLEAPPGAPRALRVAPAAPPARAAELQWQPPAKPNGVITGYVVMYAAQRAGGGAGGEGEWAAVAVPGGATRARVDRLRARTTYSFKVQARNSRGLGPFSAAAPHATAAESGEPGGLAAATSAWLWASAGGACAVLALAAALALSLCCRRHQPPLSPDTSTYQKSSASAAIKPPDLWIHHDQMELKHLDKSVRSSAVSAGSVEGGSALVSSTLTLGRAPAAPPGEYEPARLPHPPHPPASLDRRHYVPTYVDASRAPSRGSGSDDTAPLRASPAARCERCFYTPMGGMGVGSMSGMGGMGSLVNMGSLSCASTCERRQHARSMHPDQSTPLLPAGAPLPSPHALLPHALHAQPPPAPCGSGTCPLGAACSAPGAVAGAASAPTSTGSDMYACAARERGQYVAYEPLGVYTHRDSLSSDAGLSGGAAGSLRRAGGAGPAGGLCSFSDTSDHSTPTHSHRSARDASPYKKSASSSPGHLPNRLLLGGAAPAHPAELEPLTPSRSSERLQREMHNLEGLMKDLSAITHQQFHC